MKEINDLMILPVSVTASVKGASHKRSGTCCQDAVSVREGFYRGRPYWVYTVADGHGNERHLLSDRGAALATTAAEQTAVQFILSGLADDDPLATGGYAGFFTCHLREEWRRNIQQSQGTYHIEPEDVVRHGTTLLSVLVYNGCVYVAQLGDGNILTADRDGTLSYLIEPPKGPVDSCTDSLCSADTDGLWTFDCMPVEETPFLMLSTDGLYNSILQRDTFLEVAGQLRDSINKNGRDALKASLPDWLSAYSENGSGDDISLIAVSLETSKNKTIKKGQNHESTTKDKRTTDRKKAGGGGTGKCLPRKKEREESCPEAVQTGIRHAESTNHHLRACPIGCSHEGLYLKVRLAGSTGGVAGEKFIRLFDAPDRQLRIHQPE